MMRHPSLLAATSIVTAGLLAQMPKFEVSSAVEPKPSVQPITTPQQVSDAADELSRKADELQQKARDLAAQMADMTKEQLLSIADKKGTKVAKSWTKAKIIETLIQAA